MRRRHLMPFGTELLDDGRVRFRLWAPGATTVDLHLGRGAAGITLRMVAEQDGWFGIITGLATADIHYHYCIDGESHVPDPASRYQSDDVHGSSQIVDPAAFEWQDNDWHGRPWHEAVIYELHVGTFTPGGTFAAAIERLDHLVELGITAVELMPVADFPGRRNWGYDGTLLFAPDSRYGTPDDLKAFVQTAHRKGLMVLLDVVYNHFGPEGNYLHRYAPQFFTDRHHTPWGAAINYDGDGSDWVRAFVIHNAMYWLEEYHLDGLRLDAVHAIIDDSDPDILMQLAATVQRTIGRERHVHLVLENDANIARYLERNASGQPIAYQAQWNDDVHHALHVLLTGERDGYYDDYADDTLRHLGRCLAEGFAWQGESSRYRDNRPRGTPSAHLPPTAFIAFLQNHDQIGNRAFGERINTLTTPEKLRTALAILLLAPAPPLLFMGQEWGTERPFPFFCDFGPDLAPKVVAGRRNEFARFARFSAPKTRARIPDPMADATFESARLDWRELKQPEHAQWLDLHRQLLTLRRREIVPRLPGLHGEASSYRIPAPGVLLVEWLLGDNSTLRMAANLLNRPMAAEGYPSGRLLHASNATTAAPKQGTLSAWSAAWYLDDQATP